MMSPPGQRFYVPPVDRRDVMANDARMRQAHVRDERRHAEMVRRGELGPAGSFAEYPEGRAAAAPWTPGEPLHGAMVGALEAPNRIMRVAGFVSLAAGATSNSIAMQFQQSGEVIGIGLTTLGDGSLAGMSSLGLRITIADNQEELLTNGSSGDFVAFAALVGTAQQVPLCIRRYVYVNQQWLISVKNMPAAGAAFIPEVCFFFKRDPEGYRQIGP